MDKKSLYNRVFLNVLGLLFLLSSSNLAIAQVSPRGTSSSPIPSEHVSSFDTLTKNTQTKRKLKTLLQVEIENGGMLYRKGIKENLGDIYYNGMNVKIGWQTERGGDFYHQLHNYPIYGLGFYSSTFKKEELGTPYALYGFIAVPVLSNTSSNWNYNYRIGLGVAGNFNPYDEEENPFNTLIGTRRNVYIDLGFQANYSFNKNLQLGAGLALHHFSNGSIRKPNKGVNLIPLTVALSYIPNSREVDFSKGEIPTLEKKINYHVSTAFGSMQIEKNDDPKFKSTVMSYVSYPLSYKWRIGLGADFFYTQAKNSIGKEETAAEAEAFKGSRISSGLGLHFDHILTQKLHINTTIATYLNRSMENGELKPYYLRAGISYFAYKNAFVGVSIKAHAMQADFTEWTVGYRFN